ncbi:MAG: efflux RND transporter permease subunit [Betaproteobacteria bacterium]|nr:efflux RND transporter permease subunit [Betaproteobacteria bacterium]
MTFFQALLSNRPLANIAFVVVLLLGLMSFLSMPREQDPEINFNWVAISANMPGASAEDVERLVVNPLEDAISNVSDIRFVLSTAREGVATLLVRFQELSDAAFDKRMNDLRREIQNKTGSELPREVKDPVVTEITTSNGFPTASLMLTGQADDEVLRRNARRIKTDIERIKGVDRVFASGLRDAEVLVSPSPQALAARGLTVLDLGDALSGYWRDTAAGSLTTQDGAWVVSLKGVQTDPQALAELRIAVAGASGSRLAQSVRLGDVARVERSRAPAEQLASSDGQTAILYSVTKKSRVNTLHLVERLDGYIALQNEQLKAQGLSLVLTDDQTVPTREAIDVMQRNALLGMLLVLAVCWLFLGARISVIVALGIPFSLLGSFAVLGALGYTLNVSVLLGVVIALGMIVDDAVVIVEAIYYRIMRGAQAVQASIDAVAEVWKPVLASVVTTIAAFLPLMLLPGIVGKFMFVIPFVVTLALLISLAEAFWIAPVHVSSLGVSRPAPGSLALTSHPAWRVRFNRMLRLRYGQLLVKVLRRPKASAVAALASLALAVGLVVTGLVRVQFFAFDPIRLFYVNVDMPADATLYETLAETEAVEQAVRRQLAGVGPGLEARAVTATAGLKFTDTEQIWGDAYGQVTVSLQPRSEASRDVQVVVEEMRSAIEALPGRANKSFTVISGGPPSGKPINVKVRGDRFPEIEAAVAAVKDIVRRVPGATDIQDDGQPGRPQLQLVADTQALQQMGLSAAQLARLVRLSVDGEVLSFTRDEGDRIALRIRSADSVPGDPVRRGLEDLLTQQIALPGGGLARLGDMVEADVVPGRGAIRHYNLRRTVTVEANLDKDQTDTRAANQFIAQEWDKIRGQHPGIDLDFSGELEDIEESLAAMQSLFLLGIGLIYLILAAQFKSYWQPLMVLVSVPLAFTGVAYGLAISQNPLSLYTLYGVIALCGIAVNSAIVLIDAANTRLVAGLSATHAVIGAGRRRVVPVLITATTTIAGLFSLAFGLGGKSLLWGPVAASIVWGLAVSTLLTLFVVPLLYLLFMRPRAAPKGLPTSLWHFPSLRRNR